MYTPNSIPEAAAKAGIGAGGSIYSYLDLPLSVLVAAATLVFMVFQIIVILPKVISTIKGFFKKSKPE